MGSVQHTVRLLNVDAEKGDRVPWTSMKPSAVAQRMPALNAPLTSIFAVAC